MKILRKKKFISITKYNPKYRNETGAYIRDEWTSYYDIGKKSENGILDLSEYLNTEEKYIKAIFILLDFFSVNSCVIKYISKTSTEDEFSLNNDMDLYEVYTFIKKGIVVNDSTILEKLIKLALREYIGLSIRIDKSFNSDIEFGFDFYMYINTKIDIGIAIDKIEKLGLFTY